MVTIKDVAQKAQVSVATVSYVLNNRSDQVGEATRRRVLAAVDALGYSRDSRARSLRTRTSHLIGYAWHELPEGHINPIWDRFLYRMAAAAEARGYHVLTFAQTLHDPVSVYQELIKTSRVDGFIISWTTRYDVRVKALMELEFPFVTFGRAASEWDFPWIDIDGKAGIRVVTEHLIQRGHRRLALLAWPENSMSGEYRFEGYRDALAAKNIPFNPRLVVRGEHSEAFGYKATTAMLELPPHKRPTGIIALSDLMALGAMSAIEAAGLRPGHDIAVTGFDNTPMAQYLRPPLTSVRQPMSIVGQYATEMLIALIENEPLEKRQVLIQPELIVRASSGGQR